MFQRLWNLFRLKPKCTCVFNELVGLSNVNRARDPQCPTHGDAAMMNAGHCPDCQGTSFQFGPEGGVAQMIMCEGCGAQFTVEVTDPDSDPAKIIYWGRVTA